MNDSIVLIEVNGKKFSIDVVSPAELFILHGAIREILDNNFDWFSSEEREAYLKKLDQTFDQRNEVTKST